MGTLYISIILCCRVLQHLYGKKASTMIEELPEVLRFNGFRQCVSAMLALVLIIIGGKGININIETVVLSIFSGTMLAVSLGCSLYAMKTGMVSLVALFGTAGMIIPCIAGVFLFDTPIALMQWVGFALFMVAAYLMIMSSKDTVNGFSLRTMALLIAVMIADGCTMLSQQMFTQYIPNGDVSVFSFLSFGIVGIIMMVLLPINKGKSDKKTKPMSKLLITYGIVLAVAILIINQLATMATVFIPPVILFTFINGGSTVVAAIVAAVAYKEKLTIKSIIGIALGILSFVIIKMFEI